MNTTTKEIPKSHSSRKGCYWCKGALPTLKEKFLRTCDGCATDAKKAADKMATGQIKEGWKDLKEKTIGNNKAINARINIATTQHEKKIIKLAKKKGITNEEAKEAIRIFKDREK